MPAMINAKIARILLLQKGELSRSELAALPFVDSEEEVDLIISMLVNTLNAEIQQRKIEYATIPEWEDYVILSSHSYPKVSTGQ